MQDRRLSGARPGTARGTARLAHSLAFATVLALASPVGATRPGTDPREPGVRISELEPSPDGRWVALTCEPERGREVGVWLVPLDGGHAEPLTEGLPSDPEGLAWNGEGELGIEFTSRSTGRHWIDPETREVVRVEERPRSARDPLEGGWARVAARRKEREIVWVERGLRLELSMEQGHRMRITNLPGVVFHSVHERGVVRLFRHDLESDQTAEIHEVRSEVPRWSVAPDGRAIWVQDDQRQRIVDAVTGELVAGPWVEGSLEWLEQDGSRFVRISSGGHAYLVDLLLDRQVHLGELGEHVSELRVLPDGRYLQLDEDGRLDLHAPTGEVVRNLIPGAGMRTAAR